MFIGRSWPLANDHPEGPASCHPSHLCQDPDSISRTFLEQFVLVLLAQKKSLLNPGEEIMFRTSMLDDPSVLDKYSTVNNIIENMTIV